MPKGWFIIPGVQEGERTFEEQARALEPAFAQAQGKTVLDLGCAEGLLSHEFARRGAKEVVGFDCNEVILDVARSLGRGLPTCSFARVDLNKLIVKHRPTQKFDIVLALAVVHKLHDMEAGLRWVARSVARGGLLIMRTSARYDADRDILRNKRDHSKSIRITPLLAEEGVALESVVPGQNRFGEDAQYWRKVS